jgi:Na+/H+ antiporter NhaD/arsenite permease-like protein
VSITADLLALAIFLFTYCFLAFEKVPFLPLNRAGGVLVGAVAMVLSGVLGFEEAWASIDAEIIVLLAGMMILNVSLEHSGFFGLVASRVLRLRSPVVLLVGVILVSGTLSALFLNDTVCLMLTLPLLRTLEHADLPRRPYLVALAMSANVGSVMTVTGNPQNMLIHVYSRIGYLPFLARLGPVGLVNLGVLAAILFLFYRAELRQPATDAPGPRERRSAANGEDAGPLLDVRVDRALLGVTLVVLAGVLVAFTLMSNLAGVAITGAAVLLLVARQPAEKILADVDWVLLVFFSGLFVVMAGVAKTGVLAHLAAFSRPIYGDALTTQVPAFCVLTVLASNVVSNVPFVILSREMMGALIDPPLMWLVLSMASTFAGNLTTPGSVATLIVLQLAGSRSDITFWHFARVGLLVTLVTTTIGALMLLGLGAAPG